MDKMNGLPKAEPRAETVKEKTSQE
jgi:hypothetical protein